MQKSVPPVSTGAGGRYGAVVGPNGHTVGAPGEVAHMFRVAFELGGKYSSCPCVSILATSTASKLGHRRTFSPRIEHGPQSVVIDFGATPHAGLGIVLMLSTNISTMMYPPAANSMGPSGVSIGYTVETPSVKVLKVGEHAVPLKVITGGGVIAVVPYVVAVLVMSSMSVSAVANVPRMTDIVPCSRAELYDE